jgi:hypothetical protein
MIKKDLILYGVIGTLIVAGVYIVGVQYTDEKLEQYNESRQVAANWSTVNSTDTTCDEMRGHLIGLATETFDGKQLIVDAINLKYREFGC